MKKLSAIAVALVAATSCSFAFAEMSSDADQARRQQNVDEVLAKHHLNEDGTPMSTQSMSTTTHPTLRQRTHRVAEKTREKTHEIAQTTREKTHEVADSTRNFTHRQLDKSRDFSARENAKYRAKHGHEPITPAASES